MSEPNRPIAEFRIGGTITAAVWANGVQQGDRTVVRYSVQLQKRYYDKVDQKWKTSSSFFPEELPRAVLALQKAYEYIMIRAGDQAEAA